MLQLTPQVQTVLAKPADSLVDTVGVNTHLHYTDGIYYSQYDSLIKPRLLDLGIRHLRDGAYTYPGISADTFYYQRLRELAAQGIQFNLITQALDTNFGNPTRYALLDDIYQWTDQAIVSFEGVNEPDIQGVSTWVADTRQGQQQLYQAVQADPTIRHIPVIGPSVVNPQGRDRLGNLTAWTDYGNIHNYWGDRPPETTGWGANGYGSLSWNLAEATKNSGPDPVISTETGWQDGQIIPETVIARYLPRLLLTHFNAGIDRTYLYELVDQGNEQFGLLNADGSPKPAYRAVKNLIALFSDPPKAAPTARPTAQLPLALTGDTANVYYTLLQKNNGDFYLALWIGQSTDPNQTDIPDQRVSLTLPHTLQPTATLYTFLDNGQLSTATAALQNNTLTLTVKDNLRVIKLSPQISPSPTPPVSSPALLQGTPQADQLIGTPAPDLLKGYAGNDTLAGHQGNDTLLGGSGNDQLNGNAGDDKLFGEAGHDQIAGGPGSDELYGGPGSDRLLGTLQGQNEQDQLVGGPGADRFILANGSGTFYLGSAADFAYIKDFSLANGDQIQLRQNARYRIQPGYTLRSPALGSVSGQAIFLERQGYPADLVAIVQSQTSLSLDSAAFVWV